ncbi:hypothetical protein NFI96_027170 [Prochilodus magdalenae]|nr:hypothetical protein NFI96_027170 [Prochilodus magdalenae]
MDALQDWALAYPAVARLLWVIVLVLATLLIWSFFFCCWDSRSSVSPLETYLSATKKSAKPKHQSQEFACASLGSAVPTGASRGQ